MGANDQFVYLVADTLQILDASDPTQPKRHTNLAGESNLRDVFPAGDFAYFLSGGGTLNGGLKMLDMRDPANPKKLGSDALSGLWEEGSVVGMSFAGPYAALGQNLGGLQILDLSVPGQPKWVGAYYSDAPVWDVAWLGGGFACVTLGEEALPGLEVIDMSDLQHPSRAARLYLPGVNRVALLGSYACVTGQGLRVFDLSDPYHPVLVGSHQLGSGPGAETRGLQVVGNLVYVAAGEYGLAIYRLTPQLRLEPPILNATGLRLSWLGAPGIRLQKATILSDPDWQDVPGSDGASSMELSLTDRSMFFRLLKR